MADEIEIEAFLASHPPGVRDVCQRLRSLARAATPGVVEVLYARHNYIGYSLSGEMSELAVYICPLKGYARLGFMYGGQLPDPEHLLRGEGKRLRHIKIRTLDEASRPGGSTPARRRLGGC